MGRRVRPHPDADVRGAPRRRVRPPRHPRELAAEPPRRGEPLRFLLRRQCKTLLEFFDAQLHGFAAIQLPVDGHVLVADGFGRRNGGGYLLRRPVDGIGKRLGRPRNEPKCLLEFAGSVLFIQEGVRPFLRPVTEQQRQPSLNRKPLVGRPAPVEHSGRDIRQNRPRSGHGLLAQQGLLPWFQNRIRV